jgi:tripartite-type tricarboxylate transporter receptor subunit TctC
VTADERQLLELLAGSADGCTDALLTAQGFKLDVLISIVSAEFATAQPERTFAAGKPVERTRVRIGYAAGGPNDISARLAGELLSQRLSQPFVIEGRPGAGSNLATELVVRAPPDGYTLLGASSSNSWNVALYDKLNFDFMRNIAPVAGILRTTNVMEVSAVSTIVFRRMTYS